MFFGVSTLFQKLLYDFLRCDIYPDYICDNDTNKHGKDVESYIIYNPEILFNQNEEFYNKQYNDKYHEIEIHHPLGG